MSGSVAKNNKYILISKFTSYYTGEKSLPIALPQWNTNLSSRLHISVVKNNNKDYSCLTFYTRIKQNVVQASVRVNLIHKCYILPDIFTVIRAFKLYVRPLLNYASCTWSPYHILNINKLNLYKRNLLRDFLGTRHYATRTVVPLSWLPRDAPIATWFVVHLYHFT